MIPRRAFLGAAAALTALPSRLWAADPDEAPFELRGPLEQGSLVVGNAGPR